MTFFSSACPPLLPMLILAITLQRLVPLRKFRENIWRDRDRRPAAGLLNEEFLLLADSVSYLS